MVHAREQIEKAGGLVNAEDIRRRWNMSRSRMYGLAAKPDFPAPVAVVRILGKVYLWSEVESWRASNENAQKRDRKLRKAARARELAEQEFVL